MQLQIYRAYQLFTLHFRDNANRFSVLFHVGGVNPPFYGSGHIWIKITDMYFSAGLTIFFEVDARPRLVDGRRGTGPSSVAPRSRNPPTGRRRDSPISFEVDVSLCSEVLRSGVSWSSSRSS